MKIMTFDKETIIKFIIIRLSSLGDIVLTTKLIRNLKLNYPKSELFFICNEEYADLLKFNPYIDKIGLYNKNEDNEIRNLKNEIIAYNPDLIIDLQKNSRSKFLIDDFDNIVTYDKRRIYKLMLVYAKKTIEDKNLPIADIFIKPIVDFLLDFKVDDGGLEFWLQSDKDNLIYKPKLKEFSIRGKLKIAVAPAAHFKTKRWLSENFIELINLIKNKYDAEFIILGGKTEFELCEHIAIATDSKNYAGKTNIIESAELIDKCDMMICNDTGLMHIAAARQVPIAVFFGSTVQQFGFGPYKVKNIIMEKELWCRPCSHIGRNNCPLGHFNCMKKITPIFAFNKIIELINNLYKIE